MYWSHPVEVILFCYVHFGGGVYYVHKLILTNFILKKKFNSVCLKFILHGVLVYDITDSIS